MKQLYSLAIPALALVLSTPLQAASTEEIDRLYEVMRTKDLLEVMSDEGLAEAEGLQDDMLGGRGGAAWDQSLARIYSVSAMEATFRATFDAGNRIVVGDDITAVLGVVRPYTGIIKVGDRVTSALEE